ncbi:MAG: conserved membrane protein of unknown function [Promethearchaeota archaeon]|nr:MAG: conserved membrane protein of unknown function [Candidatus Lokiarchaeota archaeon]
MINQLANFRYFDFFDSVELTLYGVIVGYYFLLFAYFLFIRFRTSKKLYWFFFSILFIFLAASRVCFISYYFYIPELEGNLSTPELISAFMIMYRLATLFNWLATASLMGVLGVLLFPPDTDLEMMNQERSENIVIKFIQDHRKEFKIFARIILIILPIIIGIVAMALPDNIFLDPELVTRYDYNIELITIDIGNWSYPIGRFILVLILLPMMIAIIPFIFLYLAYKTFGVLRRSYALNAVGFFLYYTGRISQGLFDTLGWVNAKAIGPPLIILLSLLVIVVANVSYQELK